MKRCSKIYYEVLSLDNLLLAAYKALKGKSNNEVLKYRISLLENVKELRNLLITKEFVIGGYREYVIFEPKRRVISVAPLQQRIIHHAIMNVCHNRFNSNLIYDCYASRPGKGTHKAILRLKGKCGLFKYFAKLDVKKFFDSIDHGILKILLRKLFKDNELLKLFDDVIDSHGNVTGIPIGNLTSQYFANYYLSPADHYMKEIVKIPFYIRYMDDVVILCNDNIMLKSYVKCYREFLSFKLKLEIKPPIIGKISNGVPFLGYIIRSDNIRMNGKGKRRYKRNIKKLSKIFDEGKISEKEYSNRLLSVLSYAKFADSWKFRSKHLG